MFEEAETKANNGQQLEMQENTPCLIERWAEQRQT